MVCDSTGFQINGGGTTYGFLNDGFSLHNWKLTNAAAGHNGQVLTYNGGLGDWEDAGGGSGWSKTGDSGTIPGTNFIGTTDNIDLIFKVNNNQFMDLNPNTNQVIIGGLMQPVQFQLINGTQGLGKYLKSDATGAASWQIPTADVYAFDSAQVNEGDTVISVTAGNYGTYRVGGFLNVSSVSTDVATYTLVYTDENGTAQIMPLSLMNSNVLNYQASATGYYAVPDFTIRPQLGTAISFYVILTTSTGAITYNADAHIQFVHP